MAEFKIGQPYDKALIKMPQVEIINNMESIAYMIEERSYTKNLTDEELEQRKDEYSTIGIKLSEIAEKKKETSEKFKLLEKEPKSRAVELIDAIKYKSEQRYGQLYLVDDQEANMMFAFDSNGICVDARPLTKEEKQIKLKAIAQ